jgi:hypothetical protein
LEKHRRNGHLAYARMAVWQIRSACRNATLWGVVSGAGPLHPLSYPAPTLGKQREAWKREKRMTRKRVEEPRCSNGTRCVAYPVLQEPSKLSRGNPGPRCFACEERRVASELKTVARTKKVVERREANHLRWAEGSKPDEHIGREPTEVRRAREVMERRKGSVLTCKRGLRSALASGDERLARRWSRSLREAENRLAWAEADLARAEKRAWSNRAS